MVQYSDLELEEFRQIVNDRLNLYREQYRIFMQTVQTAGSNETFDTDLSFDIELDNVVDHNNKQEAANQAYRKLQTIRELEAALVRIENKTYGIDLRLGKKIPKERLQIVPWTTCCIHTK